MKNGAQQEILAALEAYQRRAPQCTAAPTMLKFVRTDPAWWRRENPQGHLTASAWIVDAANDAALLVHHRTLNRWLQPGGHLENDPSVFAAAVREASEESGLASITPRSLEIFDLDIHEIPARGDFPAHPHLDVRFVFEADRSAPLVCSAESNDLRWWSFSEMNAQMTDESVMRMVRKSLGHP